MIDEVVEGYVTRRHRRVPRGVGPRAAVDRARARSTRSSVKLADVEEEAGGRDGLDRELARGAASGRTPSAAYDEREAEFGDEVMRELERRVVLSVLDRKWREHLYEMDYLREGIGLRAYSQRDPLVEYQREGFDMFNAMMDGIKEESVGFLFNLEVQVERGAATRRSRTARGRRAAGRRASESAPAAAASRSRAAVPAQPVIRPRASTGPQPPAELPTRRRRRPGDTEVAPRARAPPRTTRSPASGATRSARAARGKKYKRCHGARRGPDRQHRAHRLTPRARASHASGGRQPNSQDGAAPPLAAPLQPHARARGTVRRGGRAR